MELSSIQRGDVLVEKRFSNNKLLLERSVEFLQKRDGWIEFLESENKEYVLIPLQCFPCGTFRFKGVSIKVEFELKNDCNKRNQHQ